MLGIKLGLTLSLQMQVQQMEEDTAVHLMQMHNYLILRLSAEFPSDLISSHQLSVYQFLSPIV